jgi:hypothetical protein
LAWKCTQFCSQKIPEARLVISIHGMTTLDSPLLKYFSFLLVLGMSFLNGIPLPDPTDPTFGIGVNKLLQYEQNYILKKVMKGEISDNQPKSVYAMLLTGDNVYKYYHPLLSAESDTEFTPVSPDSNGLSLMVPSTKKRVDVKDIDAFFVIEAVLGETQF